MRSWRWIRESSEPGGVVSRGMDGRGLDMESEVLEAQELLLSRVVVDMASRGVSWLIYVHRDHIVVGWERPLNQREIHFAVEGGGGSYLWGAREGKGRARQRRGSVQLFPSVRFSPTSKLADSL